jgi:hypothetical protein
LLKGGNDYASLLIGKGQVKEIDKIIKIINRMQEIDEKEEN